MKTKIKENAKKIFIAERFEDLTSQNLQKKEETEKTLDFIEENLGELMIVKEMDGENISICKYEGKKIHNIPLLCVEPIEEEEEEEKEIQYEEKIKKPLKIDLNKILIGLLMILMFFSGFLLKPGENIVQAEIKSQFELLTDEKNSLNIEKSKKLEEQKKLRDEIKISISEVKEIDKKIKQIDDTLIHNAQ